MELVAPTNVTLLILQDVLPVLKHRQYLSVSEMLILRKKWREYSILQPVALLKCFRLSVSIYLTQSRFQELSRNVYGRAEVSYYITVNGLHLPLIA